MTETVKKSRIVSEPDENLEASLLEEFNFRLNKCMSRDDLEKDNIDEYHRQQEDSQNQIKADLENQVKLNISNGYSKKEKEAQVSDDDHDTTVDVPLKNGKLPTNEIVKNDKAIIDEKLSSSNHDILPTTCQIEMCSEISETVDNLDSTTSVKNRMFLSTDDVSCLLFTQTVTSPMLTPSEENIDFLKGFRRESNGLNAKIESTNQVISVDKIILDEKSPDLEEINGVEPDKLEMTDVADDPINIIFDDNQECTTSEAQCSKSILSENVHEIYTDVSANEKPNKEIVSPTIDEDECLTFISDVKQLKNQFNMGFNENVKSLELDEVTREELEQLKSLDIMKQIHKFENTLQDETNTCSNTSTVIESQYVESTTEVHTSSDTNLKKKKTKKIKSQHEKENISVNETNTNNKEESLYNVNVTNLKSSFNKFDALQKKNVLTNREQDGIKGVELTSCKKCGKPVFQMERIIAEKCAYHRNCFRCVECSKQLLVDNFETHEGTLYCKPHFKALFNPKAVEDDTPAQPRKHELIIRENQPAELPPDVIRASSKTDLGLEELQSLNVKERFRVFENAHESNEQHLEKSAIKMERSPSILSKLARFQAKGMDVGVSNDALNGIPVELSESEEEEEEEDGINGEDAELIKAKRVQKEKPFHFSQMSDVKNKWEQGNQKDDRREERKQEIQNIRSRLFMGKQGKMKEAYQQAIAESESGAYLKKEVPLESADTRSIKDKFEKGELVNRDVRNKEMDDMAMFESGISKQSRTLFMEMDQAIDGSTSKIPTSPVSPKVGGPSVRSAREAYIAKTASEDTVRSTDHQDEITVRTADIQNRFKFFETYKEPEQKRKEFRITPPRDGQVKGSTPEREVYIDPNIVRAEDFIEDSVVAKATHTTTKMLNKFRQMEENLQNPEPKGLKPLKRFTPPREPIRQASSSEEESEEEQDVVDYNSKLPEQELIEAQKAARAKQLKAKFENWDDQNEVRRDNSVSLIEEYNDEQSQIETAKSLRAKFESLRETQNNKQTSRVIKVNRFVDIVQKVIQKCESCHERVYPLECTAVHGLIFHKNCFRCKECNTVLRMDTYCYNRGLLYCTTHFKRLFITKGNYDSAFGLDEHKEKWGNTSVIA